MILAPHTHKLDNGEQVQSDPVRRVTLGRLTPAELLHRLSCPGPEPAILGEIICAMYWGGRKVFDLQRIEQLSEHNWKLATEIMAYRRSKLWSELQFHVIAQWCREYFSL